MIKAQTFLQPGSCHQWRMWISNCGRLAMKDHPPLLEPLCKSTRAALDFLQTQGTFVSSFHRQYGSVLEEFLRHFQALLHRRKTTWMGTQEAVEKSSESETENGKLQYYVTNKEFKGSKY